MIECPNCHEQLKEEASFCSKCGSQLKTDIHISATPKHPYKKITIITMAAAVIVILAVILFGKISSADEVRITDEQLQGTWTRSLDNGGGLYYSFDNGNFEANASIGGIRIPGEQGTYKISDGKIIISVSGGTSEQYYLLKDGELHLYLFDPAEYEEDELAEYELFKIN